MRRCAWCKDELPDDCRSQALFCSAAHRLLAHRARRAEARAAARDFVVQLILDELAAGTGEFYRDLVREHGRRRLDDALRAIARGLTP